jgi:hypothetical protein
MKMVANQIQAAFDGNGTVSREDLRQFCRRINPSFNDRSFDWLVYHLCREQIIRRVARNAFVIYRDEYVLADYRANLTAEAKRVLDYLSGLYPFLSFSVWETKQLNEFANHQLERNYIFVEIEKPLEQSVFRALQEEFALPALYKPSEDDLYLYSGQVTLVVLALTSEAPVYGHRAAIEKVLADLWANRLVDSIISSAEHPNIFEEAFSKYSVNKNALMRYARRRGKADEIKVMLEMVAGKEGEAVYDKP